MKTLRITGISIVFIFGLLSIIATGGGGGGNAPADNSGSNPSTDNPTNSNITITGAVIDEGLPNATVAMTNMSTGQEIADTISDSSSNWSLTVDRSNIAADASYLLMATNPANGLDIHSIIDGSDLLSGSGSYSSDSTTISNYTEAAYLVAQTDSGRKAGQFLKEYIHLSKTGLPISTGEDTVDALAVWVKGKFDDPSAVNGSTYRLNLLSQILGYKWPTIVVYGTDTSFTLPASLLGEGAAVVVNSFQGVQSVTVTNGQVEISAGNNIGQGQVVFQLSQGGTQQNLTLPITVVSGQVLSSKTIKAGSTTPVTAGALSVVPDDQSFPQNASITISQIDLRTLPSQKIGYVDIELMYDIQLDTEPTSPVQIHYQLSGTDDPNKVVLIHINPATKDATYVYPDSYDATTKELTFTLNGLSDVAVGTTDSNPSYSLGDTFTVSDLKSDPAGIFNFISSINDQLNNQDKLDAIQTVQSDGKNSTDQINYLVALSSKALTSFMELPTAPTNGSDSFESLNNITYSTGWWWWPLKKSHNALTEYSELRCKIDSTLYKVTNAKFVGVSIPADDNEDYSEMDLSLLYPEENLVYYLPTIAYRVLNLGCKDVDSFLTQEANTIASANIGTSEQQQRYQAIADWISGDIQYKYFTTPKVVVDTSSDQSNQIIENIQDKVSNFMHDAISDEKKDASKEYLLELADCDVMAGFVETTGTTITVKEGFADFNDILDAISAEQNDNAIINDAEGNDSYTHPLGSSVDYPWFGQDNDDTWYIPYEVNDEIANLKNWQKKFEDYAAGTDSPPETGNTAPDANAGPDQNVTTGSTVTLDGSKSTTSTGDSLSYSWSFYSKPSGSSAVISNPTIVNPTFVADVDGTYKVELVVNDGTADSKANIVSITASSVGTSGNLGQNWNLMNSTYDQSSGVGSMKAIRDRTEYAYKQLQWDGKSNINISVDVKSVTVPSYAEYITFRIFPASWLADRSTDGEPDIRLLQVGYADSSPSQIFTSVQQKGQNGTAMPNPTLGTWYTFKWSYVYETKTLAMTVTDESGNQVFSKDFSNIDFGFNSSNRIIGFFSPGIDAGYGNPSETIQFRNLTVN